MKEPYKFFLSLGVKRQKGWPDRKAMRRELTRLRRSPMFDSVYAERAKPAKVLLRAKSRRVYSRIPGRMLLRYSFTTPNGNRIKATANIYKVK